MAKPTKKKKQHIIPKCYSKAWCDPATPTGHKPYIWQISKDGNTRKKRSPEKSFRETDRYTIKLPRGKRELIVENTLMQTENAFVRLLPKIRRRQELNDYDRAHLCVFTAAMFSRTKAKGDHFRKQFRRLHEVVEDLEQAHGAEPKTSLETKLFVDYAHQYTIGSALSILPQMFSQMSLAIFETDSEVGFITSDTPCVWFDPDAYKRPPFYRSPGLARRKIEVTLPLTPQHLLFISHSNLRGYLRAVPRLVDEVNRRTRFYCADYFVSWKGETKPYWFDPGQEPEDSWERSDAGKRVLAEREKRAKAKAEWEASQDSKSKKE